MPGAPAAGTTSSPSSVPAPTTSVHADTHTGGTVPSTPAIALAVLAAVLVLLSLGWAIARAFAYEPSWMPSLRHCLAEAGFRASATFAELGDWLRRGR